MGKKQSVEYISGEVERTSKKGVRIDNEWYNYSKFHDVDEPDEGDVVDMEVSGDWIHSIDIHGKERKSSRREDRDEAREEPEEKEDKQTIINRLSLLSTAAIVLSSGGRRADHVEVIHLAAFMERYVKYGQLPPIKDLDTKQKTAAADKNIDGHEFHGEEVAEIRVKRLMTWGSNHGYKTAEDVKETIYALFGGEKPVCLHKWTKDFDNWTKINDVILKEDTKTLYG